MILKQFIIPSSQETINNLKKPFKKQTIESIVIQNLNLTSGSSGLENGEFYSNTCDLPKSSAESSLMVVQSVHLIL